jgi:hypothetical protein
MKPFTMFAALLLLAASPAKAGLGESSSPQRARCESQAAAKFQMWQWFSRRDFVARCLGAGQKPAASKKKKAG